MKIEGAGKPLGAVQVAETRPRVETKPSQQGSGSDKVELSTLSSSLQKAEAAISETPVVDRSRVEEIKLAISEGRFKIDADKIASGLIDSVRQMLNAQPERS